MAEGEIAMKGRSVTILFLTLILTLSLAAQTPVGTAVTAEMRAAANDAYQKQDWTTAAEHYGKILKLDDKNVGARYRYGIVMMNLEKNAEAKQALDNAFAASPNAIFALALARVNARLADPKSAMEVLERSVSLGGIAPETLTAEKDFASLRRDPKFQDIVKRSDLAVNPCKAAPEFRQFDFWIGEWEAKNPQGLVGGTSSIQLILGTCIIFENWTGTSGTNGKSFNIYDASDKKWHQTWVDDKGTFTHYVGGIQNGSMVLVADTVVGGKKTLAKMTFTKLANGDVRQHGENSADDGKTWTTTFDFTYVRKK
jgi:hypothetical protein